MVAPFPPVALAGGINYEQRAKSVARLYENIARLSQRIVTAAPDVSLLDIADLAFIEGPQYTAQANDVSPEFKRAVIGELEDRGYEWDGTPTQNQKLLDLAAIRDEVIAFKAWVEANLPEIVTAGSGAGYVVYSSSVTNYSLDAKTVPNTHLAVAEVQKVRNLYTAVA